jgi:acetylornithine deacetylase/succinyl-diaminopimelate desuccinylase-like protein
MRLSLLVLTSLLAACDQATPAREFDGPTAFSYLEQQVNFGFRIPGTPAHAETAKWIDSLLRQRADTVIEQAWDHVTADGKTLPMRNYIARFNVAATERVLYLAHWDTRPISDSDKWKGDRQLPVPGANDGASGVAMLLGVADALKKVPPKVGVDLLFVDGEDYGDFQATPPNDVLIGSRYYAQHLVSGSRPLYAILFDMVGDKNLNFKREGNSLLGAPEVVELVWTVAREIGHGQYFETGNGPVLTDDHVELQKVGIRAIDVVDFDYPEWHTPDDKLDKVSAASLQIIGDVAMALIRRH